ncbi:MAG: ATP-dependent helicase HrpB [Alteromonadaceae bacterium]|nr:ATP-dependent helicase HrpB [Alteromonadaceae bacterium]
MSKILPIEAIKSSLLSALNTHNTLVLSAPPGAGKSTCLPLWLLDVEEFSSKKIYLLQPRRIAAKNIATYLAKQLGEPVGKTVGYRLRNDNKVSASTRLEVITEGILTQIIQNDAELADCALIVLDEFHERSLHADLAFALARDVQQNLNEDLKILIMSATLAVESLLKQLPDSIALHSEGRSFPVEVSYQAPPSSKFWREHALKVIKHSAQQRTDQKHSSILVFLPGVADIRYLVEGLRSELPANMLLCPLYGELTLAEQQQAILPAKEGMNKLVLATNIAETSLTIEGVNLVIDCGLEKIALYQQQSLTNRLHQQAISKSSAVQRAGRAGRLMPGECIRLYSQEDFDRRREFNISEIQQTDLLPLLIEAARWGVKQLADLPLLEFPEKNRELLAWQELQQLSIVDEKRRLNAHGKQVAKLGCHPRFAHMIVTGQQLEQRGRTKKLAALACVITALLEERDTFHNERARYDCDLRHRIIELMAQLSPTKNYQGNYQRNHQNSYQHSHKRIIDQAKRLASKINISIKTDLPIEHTGTLLALAYPERIAKYRGRVGEFLTSNGKGISLIDEDALACQPYLLAAQISQYQQKLQIRLAAPVDLNNLIDWQIISTDSEVITSYDDKQNRIIAMQQLKLGAIVIEEKSLSASLTEQQIASMWQEQLQLKGLNLLQWQEKDKMLLGRWRWLNVYQTHLNFPEASEQALLQQLSTWFDPYVGKLKAKAQLQKLKLSEMLLTLLDYKQQQQLSKLAPTHFIGPTGRNCPIRYTEEQYPTVSLPMQELYGVKVTPSVGDSSTNNSVPLKLELLSPAQRPIQVTQDLVKFWKGSYKAVQKDMKSQYPKHYWPDDPVNAKATNKTKRHIKN